MQPTHHRYVVILCAGSGRKLWRFLARLDQSSCCSQRLGFIVSKTNYIIKALVEKGLIKVERFADRKKTQL